MHFDRIRIQFFVKKSISKITFKTNIHILCLFDATALVCNHTWPTKIVIETERDTEISVAGLSDSSATPPNGAVPRPVFAKKGSTANHTATMGNLCEGAENCWAQNEWVDTRLRHVVWDRRGGERWIPFPNCHQPLSTSANLRLSPSLPAPSVVPKTHEFSWSKDCRRHLDVEFQINGSFFFSPSIFHVFRSFSFRPVVSQNIPLTSFSPQGGRATICVIPPSSTVWPPRRRGDGLSICEKVYFPSPRVLLYYSAKWHESR